MGRSANEGAMDTQALDFVIHHVFLPPRLPQKDDQNASHTLATAQLLRDSVSNFFSTEGNASPPVQTVLRMLERFIATDLRPALDEGPKKNWLRSCISDLGNGGTYSLLRWYLYAYVPGGRLPWKITPTETFHSRCCAVLPPSPNAGLLLTARQDDMLFEAFELLAPNADVMSCKGVLRRAFPDRGAAISLKILRDDGLLDEVVDVLYELDRVTAPIVRQKVAKAGTAQPELRDISSTVLVTGMLMDILVGLGKSVEPHRVYKRSREQVNWHDAYLPFRPSPIWLLLRVALRLVLDRQIVPGGDAASQYKQVMAYHHARILDIGARRSQSPIPSNALFSMKAKLVRRIVKLDPAEDSPWLEEVRDIVSHSQVVLQKRWDTAQRKEDKRLPLKELAKVFPRQDTELKLRNLRQYLSWIKSRPPSSRETMGSGDTTRFGSLSCPNRPVLPALRYMSQGDTIIGFSRLLEFQSWAELVLPVWLDIQLNIDVAIASHEGVAEVLGHLIGLIHEYHAQALKAYEGMPDALSVMYLVIMELWVAMDKIAWNAIPLLLDYDPGFP